MNPGGSSRACVFRQSRRSCSNLGDYERKISAAAIGSFFWASAALAFVALLGWHYAARAVDEAALYDPRLYDPHQISQLRGAEYPFTIEVNGYKYQGKTGDYIDDHILAYGAYEKDVLFFMRDYVRARNNPDAVFLDVGACEGQHSLFMSRLVKQVHAFEPFPPAADHFRQLRRAPTRSRTS